MLLHTYKTHTHIHYGKYMTYAYIYAYSEICTRSQTYRVEEAGEYASSSLTAETVEGAALAFQSVDDVHGGDGLPLGVLGVSDGVTDHVLEEHL